MCPSSSTSTVCGVITVGAGSSPFSASTFALSAAVSVTFVRTGGFTETSAMKTSLFAASEESVKISRPSGIAPKRQGRAPPESVFSAI